ncbi:MAG: hypothetical protein K2K07_01490, partial [Lachnospiraceae bacterium]|nr:hypothetical protein [Lachnospiraceae bacterium]
MRKRCWKTVLSAILASAMLFTSVPTNLTMTVHAQEPGLEDMSDDVNETEGEDEQENENSTGNEPGGEQDVQNPVGGDMNVENPADDGDGSDEGDLTNQTGSSNDNENLTDQDDPSNDKDDFSTKADSATTGEEVDGTSVTFTYVGDENTKSVEVVGAAEVFGKWTIGKGFPLIEGEDHVFSATKKDMEPGAYEYQFIVNGSWLGVDNSTFTITDPDGIETPVINGRMVTFRYKDKTGEVKKVQLTGNMTDWATEGPDFEKKDGDIWELTMEFAPGAYQYKLLVDGEWTVDPGITTWPIVGGNNTFAIAGLSDAEQDVKLGGSATLPATLKLWSADGASSDVAVTYTLADATLADKVTLTSETVEGAVVTTVNVAADLPSTVKEFELTATDGTNTSTVTISVKTFTCVYTIYYYDPDPEHMAVDKAALWLWQTSGAGAKDITEFKETEELSDGNTWLKTTVELGYTDVSLIPRAYDSWAWQDGEGKKFVNEKEEEAVTLYTVYDDPKIYTELPEIKSADPRYLVAEYTRTTQTDRDWYFYTWNGGYGDAFEKFEDEDGDGTGTAKIPVKQGLETISFCLERTDDSGAHWGEKDGNDYTCPLPVDQNVIKIKIEEGKGITYTYPYNTGYEIDTKEGKINFYYRDDEAFLAGNKGGYADVSLEVIAPKADTNAKTEAGEEETSKQTVKMTYDEKEQRYEYVLDQLVSGDHYYRYGRQKTADDAVEYVLDDFNELKDTVGGTEYSVLKYELLDVEMEVEIQNDTMDYNDNNVLAIKVNAKDLEGNPVEDTSGLKVVEKATVDLSALGGGVTEIDPELLAVSIAVKQGTTAGEKTLPVAIYDVYNNEYKTEAKVTVVDRNKGSDFDWDEAVIYFAVTDRFFDGNASNNNGDASGSYDKDTNNGSNSSYHGGDFAGLTQKLDYLKDLGVNTIWITPIVENQTIANSVTDPEVKEAWGYHGYWAKDFTKLDSHLGTEAEFSALLDAAHAKGMKIMVDVVLNHSGYGDEITSTFNNFKNE